MPEDRWARAAAALSVAALVAAVVLGVFYEVGARRAIEGLPPTPPAPAASSPTVGPESPAPVHHHRRPKPATCSRPHATTLGGDSPVEVCVPQIGVDASVMRLGLNADRTVQVPPLSRVGDAGWYEYSAAPGVAGPTVILGHIDSAVYGEGVFYELGNLRSGDSVKVTRADGRIATFDITRVREVPKTNFPTQSVYGATSRPTIRLVTCGGQFDASTGNYLDNIIVYGTLRSLSRVV